MTEQARALPSADTQAVAVAERIHLLMWRQKIDQTTMAAAIGCNQSTLSKKLRGKVAFRVSEIIAAAGVIGVHPGSLFSDVPASNAGGELPRLDSNQQPFGYRSSQVSARPVTPLRPARAPEQAPQAVAVAGGGKVNPARPATRHLRLV